jgi:hypothetical protein
MAHTNAPIAWRKVSKLLGLLGTPVVLFWSLGFAFQRMMDRRLPALTDWPRTLAVLAFVALGLLGCVLLAWGRLRACWVGLTFFRSTLLAYFLAAPIVLLLSSLLTVGTRVAPQVERQVLVALVTFWLPLWWAPSLGVLMTGWRLGRLYRRA